MHFFAKRILKRQVQRAIAAFGRQNWAFPKNRLIILTYHRVLPRNHPALPIMQPGMVVRDDTFAMHIAVLKRRFQLVSLRDRLHALLDKYLETRLDLQFLHTY